MMIIALIFYVTQVVTVVGFMISGLLGNDLTNAELGLMICCAMNTILLDRITDRKWL